MRLGSTVGCRGSLPLACSAWHISLMRDVQAAFGHPLRTSDAGVTTSFERA